MKINPNSFITFEAQYQDPKNAQWTNLELSVPCKNIMGAEKYIRTIDQESVYWIFAKVPNTTRETDFLTRKFKITEEKYNEIKSLLPEIDFNIPIIETVEQIKEMVKEEVSKTKQRSAISSLDLKE